MLAKRRRRLLREAAPAVRGMRPQGLKGEPKDKPELGSAPDGPSRTKPPSAKLAPSAASPNAERQAEREGHPADAVATRTAVKSALTGIPETAGPGATAKGDARLGGASIYRPAER